MNTAKAIEIKKKTGSGESPRTIPHFSHNRLYCSMRQSDSIGSAQKLDTMRIDNVSFSG